MISGAVTKEFPTLPRQLSRTTGAKVDRLAHRITAHFFYQTTHLYTGIVLRGADGTCSYCVAQRRGTAAPETHTGCELLEHLTEMLAALGHEQVRLLASNIVLGGYGIHCERYLADHLIIEATHTLIQ